MLSGRLGRLGRGRVGSDFRVRPAFHGARTPILRCSLEFRLRGPLGLRIMRGVGFRSESEIESSPRAFGQPMTRRWCLLVPMGAEPRLAAQRGIPSRPDLGVQSKATVSVRSFGTQADGGPRLGPTLPSHVGSRPAGRCLERLHLAEIT
jgi:hypothetical protein